MVKENDLEMQEKNEDSLSEGPGSPPKKPKRGCLARLGWLLAGLVLFYMVWAEVCYYAPWPLPYFLGAPQMIRLHHFVFRHLPFWGEAQLRADAEAYLRKKYGADFAVGKFFRVMYDWPTVDLRYYYEVVAVSAYLKQSPDIFTGLHGNTFWSEWEEGDNFILFAVWQNEIRQRAARALGDDLVFVDLTRSHKPSEVRFAEDLNPGGRIIGFDEAKRLLSGDFSFTAEVGRYYFCSSADRQWQPASVDRVREELRRLQDALSPDIDVVQIWGSYFAEEGRAELEKKIDDYYGFWEVGHRDWETPYDWGKRHGLFLGHVGFLKEDGVFREMR